MPPMTGRVIAGRYNLQHPIGRGAMGVVWRARDQLLDRDVAVKEVVISAMIGEDEKRNAYQRTLREARTAARLSHRGVVAVYDVAEEDGRPWIVMELVPSRSLDQVLTVEGRLSAARTCRIGQQLLSALAAAHTAGVLHRDVKPSNVLIATDRIGDSWDERAVLTDFGIAQFEGDPRLTQTGMVMGSPGFTAPERIRGGDATPGSDLWSLGATLYAAVEGRGPYEQRGGAITTMSAIINEDAPVAPHAAELAPLIAALLRRDPSTRPSAAAAARMFAQVLPRLTEAPAEKPASPHPPTALAEFVPPPAAPVASAPATAPEGPSRDEASEAPPRRACRGPSPRRPSDAGSGDAALRRRGLRRRRRAGGAAGTGTREGRGQGKDQPRTKTEDAADAAAEPSAADAAAGEAKPAATPLDRRRVADDRPRRGHRDRRRRPSRLPSYPGRDPGGTGGDGGTAAATARAAPASAVLHRLEADRPRDTDVLRGEPGEPGEPREPAAPGTAIPPGPPGAGAAFRVRAGQCGGGRLLGQHSTVHAGRRTVRPPAASTPAPRSSTRTSRRQYAPGSGGGRAVRRGGGARWVIWLVVAVIVAAAIGVGTALALNKNKTNETATNTGNTGTAGGAGTPTPSVADTPVSYKSVNALNDPSTVLPSGWTSYTVTAADAGESHRRRVHDRPAAGLEEEQRPAAWTPTSTAPTT